MVACCPQRVSDKPECRASLVNAGTTLKAKKDDLSLRWSEVHEISNILKKCGSIVKFMPFGAN